MLSLAFPLIALSNRSKLSSLGMLNNSLELLNSLRPFCQIADKIEKSLILFLKRFDWWLSNFEHIFLRYP